MEKTMEKGKYQEVKAAVVKKLEVLYPGKVQERVVVKNDGPHDGIVIAEGQVSPTVYVDLYYKEFEALFPEATTAEMAEEITKHMAKAIDEAPKPQMDTDALTELITNWSYAKDYVTAKLV